MSADAGSYGVVRWAEGRVGSRLIIFQALHCLVIFVVYVVFRFLSYQTAVLLSRPSAGVDECPCLLPSNVRMAES